MGYAGAVTSFHSSGFNMPEHWSDRSRSPPRRASPAARSQHQPRPPYRSRSRSPDRPREFQGAAARRPSPSHAQGRDVYPHQQHRSPPAPHFSRYEGAGHDYERSRSRPFSDQYSSYQQQQPRDKEDAGRWRQFDAPLHHQQQPPPPQQQPYRHNEAPPSPTLMLRGLAPAVHDAMVVLRMRSKGPEHRERLEGFAWKTPVVVAKEAHASPLRVALAFSCVRSCKRSRPSSRSTRASS